MHEKNAEIFVFYITLLMLYIFVKELDELS